MAKPYAEFNTHEEIKKKKVLKKMIKCCKN